MEVTPICSLSELGLKYNPNVSTAAARLMMKRLIDGNRELSKQLKALE